jgi:hypothetical protein
VCNLSEVSPRRKLGVYENEANASRIGRLLRHSLGHGVNVILVVKAQ